MRKELHDLCASPIIRHMKMRMRWAWHVAHMVEMRNAYKILVRKPEGKRLLGRPSHTWEDNITTYLREMGGGRYELDLYGSG
jgi:hypothetical protein